MKFYVAVLLVLICLTFERRIPKPKVSSISQFCLDTMDQCKDKMKYCEKETDYCCSIGTCKKVFEEYYCMDWVSREDPRCLLKKEKAKKAKQKVKRSTED